MNLRKMEGKSMRIRNRVIVAGALVVPMGLGVSGIAVADAAGGNSVLPTQIGVSEDDGSGDCDGDDDFLGLGLFGGGNDSDDGVCGGDNGEDDNGPLG
ncbi:MAG TPA: hypothetical protein VNA67_04225 [Pseudonocardiaceae bacterium]|nr:hypothetical protein [Pseudonocardiaceae bacterium]